MQVEEAREVNSVNWDREAGLLRCLRLRCPELQQPAHVRAVVTLGRSTGRAGWELGRVKLRPAVSEPPQGRACGTERTEARALPSLPLA